MCTQECSTLKWKQPKCPSADKWINKRGSLHSTECYSAIRRNEMLTHATSWVNLGIYAKRKKPNTDHILFDYIHIKCPE